MVFCKRYERFYKEWEMDAIECCSDVCFTCGGNFSPKDIELMDIYLHGLVGEFDSFNPISTDVFVLRCTNPSSTLEEGLYYYGIPTSYGYGRRWRYSDISTADSFQVMNNNGNKVIVDIERFEIEKKL